MWQCPNLWRKPMIDVAVSDVAAEERTDFLSNFPAGRRQRRLACAVMAASTVIFLILAPFAKVALWPVPAFIPIYQSALLVNDLIAAVFLLGQRQLSRSHGLNLLAGGYLFTALMSTVHALSFPGVFAPTGLLDAGPQTTAWLYMFWHGGFPLFVIAYTRYGLKEQPAEEGTATIAGTVGSIISLVCGLGLLATVGQALLPAIMQDNRYTPAMNIVVSAVWLLNLLALYALSRRRPYSMLDLWLIVTMCAWLFDIALSAVLNAGRYDLGFYAGRIYGLLAASFVLVVLLHEHGKLYVQLVKLRDSDREKTDELRRLSTVDPLTGVANRRAFEDALAQEWRRMMRHGTTLSLLMVDVDCFKRFNDAYGHVAGDQCLRVVAQVLAGKARRAGEMAARYGGEEFAVLLPHVDIVEAKKLGEVICKSVSDCKILHVLSDAAPYVTISVGAASIADLPELVATLSREATLPSATMPGATVLVETADHALYRAKRAGRNRVVAAGIDDAADEPTVASCVSPAA
jgi:diguanylate cyclase (GGDEF)-like protein